VGDNTGTDMSDTSNLANNNIEPSMEDILSSIRKVISDDMAHEETAELMEEPADGKKLATDVSVEARMTQENIQPDSSNDDLQIAPSSELDPDIFEDILDLEMLVGDLDEAPEGPVAPSQPDTEPDLMSDLVSFDDDLVAIPEDVELEDVLGPDENIEVESVEVETNTPSHELGFDASLDLVMDSDANDYITTNTLLPDAEVETETAPELMDEQTQAQFNPPLEADPSVENVEDEPTSATPDEDIDLVKSLLADLMDEPVQGEPLQSEPLQSDIEDGLVAETPTFENPSFENPVFENDEALNADIDAIAEEQFLAEELIIPEPAKPTAPELTADKPENLSSEDLNTENLNTEGLKSEPEIDTTLSEIAKSAREAGETDIGDIAETKPHIQSGDIVDISKTNMISKLALLASATSATAAVDNHALDDAQDNNHEQVIEVADLVAPVSTPEDEPQHPHIDEPAQEDDAMVTPLQKETLMDEETEKDTSSAFASLTTAVAEKSMAEENGPPIGELVKEALKPMLQEWLDKNLKSMVQRAVTKEIKRISSSK